ncbi:MAG: flagellar basal-body MS-ring/collar protein FliF [Ignavibacteria bacterium]|nr:flagellar basal-body MS-ring/collar protein FliF [Ignavibacteria bacterium]
MAEFRTQFTGQIRSLADRLNATQKLVIAGATITVLAAFIGLVVLVNQPVYGTLFSNLAPADASKVVEKLKEKQVAYRLEDSGRTVLIPRDQVYDLRLSLAGEGLPQSSVAGYEIFDRTNLGVSDFVQRMNMRRAQEGELARTILTLNEVEGVRVHIVLPDKVLFKEDEKPATASVVLKLRSAAPLKRDVIDGIAHLVASSVEGLEASNVTILDSRGVLLSNNTKANTFAALTASQYELQQSVESYVAGKARGILEGVVGSGNALVEVNADLDFRKVERTLEQYDPDNAAVRSEQLTEERTTVGDSLPPSTRSNNITNYEVNKTIEHVVENVGNIKRLSVAVVVNGVQKEVENNGQPSKEITPRSQKELDQLTDLVKKAVGFTPQRNDEVTVINLPFGNGLEREDFVYDDTPIGDNDLFEKILLIAAMIVAVVIIWSLLKWLKSRVPTGETVPAGVFGHGAYGQGGQALGQNVDIRLPAVEEEISHEALLRAEKRKRLESYLQEKPTDAALLLKVWLAEE